jgi:hypothetical protein
MTHELKSLEPLGVIRRDYERMYRTLLQAGYIDCGGEYWKPPLGKNPLLAQQSLVELLREIAAHGRHCWSVAAHRELVQMGVVPSAVRARLQSNCVHSWTITSRIGSPHPEQLCDSECGLAWKDRPT